MPRSPASKPSRHPGRAHVVQRGGLRPLRNPDAAALDDDDGAAE
ncbi:hypothetical protein [Streptomyces atratus]